MNDQNALDVETPRESAALPMARELAKAHGRMIRCLHEQNGFSVDEAVAKVGAAPSDDVVKQVLANGYSNQKTVKFATMGQFTDLNIPSPTFKGILHGCRTLPSRHRGLNLADFPAASQYTG